VVVATTRPETMLGDTGVAVHPDDDRYRDLVGKTVVLPLMDREIPVVADDTVDPEFGTGAVKVTPGHDFADNERGQRHGLEMINIFTIDAALNDAVPAPYRGLDRLTARLLRHSAFSPIMSARNRPGNDQQSASNRPGLGPDSARTRPGIGQDPARIPRPIQGWEPIPHPPP